MKPAPSEFAVPPQTPGRARSLREHALATTPQTLALPSAKIRVGREAARFQPMRRAADCELDDATGTNTRGACPGMCSAACRSTQASATPSAEMSTTIAPTAAAAGTGTGNGGSDKKGGLSAGATAGIAIAALLLVGGGLVLAILINARGVSAFLFYAATPLFFPALPALVCAYRTFFARSRVTPPTEHAARANRVHHVDRRIHLRCVVH